MSGLKRYFYRKITELNIMPTKIVTLPTGVVCYHYASGNIKVIG
jgi:hypothetical protein